MSMGTISFQMDSSIDDVKMSKGDISLKMTSKYSVWNDGRIEQRVPDYKLSWQDVIGFVYREWSSGTISYPSFELKARDYVGMIDIVEEEGVLSYSIGSNEINSLRNRPKVDRFYFEGYIENLSSSSSVVSITDNSKTTLNTIFDVGSYNPLVICYDFIGFVLLSMDEELVIIPELNQLALTPSGELDEGVLFLIQKYSEYEASNDAGKIDILQKSLKKGIDTDYFQFHVLTSLVVLYSRNGKYNDALQLYQAQKDHMNYVERDEQISISRNLRRNFPEKKYILDKILDNDTNSLKHLIAAIEYQTGDYFKAREMLEELILVHQTNMTMNEQDYVNVLQTYGNTLTDLTEFELARNTYENGIKLAKKVDYKYLPQLMLAYAFCLRSVNEIQEAFDLLREARKVAKNSKALLAWIELEWSRTLMASNSDNYHIEFGNSLVMAKENYQKGVFNMADLAYFYYDMAISCLSVLDLEKLRETVSEYSNLIETVSMDEETQSKYIAMKSYLNVSNEANDENLRSLANTILTENVAKYVRFHSFIILMAQISSHGRLPIPLDEFQRVLDIGLELSQIFRTKDIEVILETFLGKYDSEKLDPLGSFVELVKSKSNEFYLRQIVLIKYN